MIIIIVRANYLKAKTDDKQQNTKRRFCGERDEMMNHIVSECIPLAQEEYKTRQD